MNRKICILLTFLILLAALVPFASASQVYLGYFQPAPVGALQINNMNTNMSWVQTFNATNTGQVLTVTLNMARDDNFDATITAILMSTSAGAPNLVLETSSTTYNTLSDLAGVFTNYIFTFSGTTLLNKGTFYAVGINVTAVTHTGLWHGVSAGGVLTNSDTGAPYYCIDNANYQAVGGTVDFSYIVVGEATVFSATPTPPPSGTDFWETGIGAQIFGFIPTLTSLIVVLFAAFLGWKFAGPWGFFAGINVGYVVSVMFNLLPLWGFIALLVVDGLLLFGKVGFRN